jgi:NADH:ubiquinone oxidoreductase subunit 2 (subunit N)
LIPPLLGFYAKLFVISDLTFTNFYISIIAIITSVISCVRYLNIIQLSNFYMNPKSLADNKIVLNSIISYIISIITLF